MEYLIRTFKSNDNLNWSWEVHGMTPGTLYCTNELLGRNSHFYNEEAAIASAKAWCDSQEHVSEIRYNPADKTANQKKML